MTISPRDSHRSARRTPASINTVVRIRENEETSWTENVATVSVSSLGAGFYISGKCEVGCLVSLIMPLPHEFRKYDHDREMYRVWGVVQHCSPGTTEAGERFYVGVAFIGKSAPASYQANPKQCYRILGLSDDGLWALEEMAQPFVSRQYPRYAVALNVNLIKLGPKKKPIAEEKAVTENVSAGGASVLSNLETRVNDRIKFENDSHGFSSVAVVKNTRAVDTETYRMNLEFVKKRFPVKELVLAFEDEAVD